MMIASRDSVAYEQYEERFPEERSKRDLRVAPSPRRRRKVNRKPGLILCVLVVALTAVYILFCQMQLTQLTAETSAQSNKLDELAAENISLTTKQANSVDMTAVEEYASGTLGMVKMDNSQVEYVELTNPDSVTVAESAVSLERLFSGLVHGLSALVEYIR